MSPLERERCIYGNVGVSEVERLQSSEGLTGLALLPGILAPDSAPAATLSFD